MDAQTTNKASRKLAAIEELMEQKGDDQRLITLPTGTAFALPPDVSRETMRAGERSQRVKLEKWDGKIPYDTSSMCFFFKNLLQWGLLNQATRIVDNRAVFDDHRAKLAQELERQHREFRVCPDPKHARLWEFEPCVGIGTLNAQMETEECNICAKNASLNGIFLRHAKDLIDSVKSSAEARDKFYAARKRFLGLYYDGDPRSVLTSAARQDLCKAFFIYTAWMWEIAEEYRQKGGGSKEVHDSFSEYMQDFMLMRERDGPYMFCAKHEAIGDAVPWMRKEDYKDCMICMSKERRDQDVAADSAFLSGVKTGTAQSQLLADVGEREQEEDEKKVYDN
jgi:hypothetical protein